ncbi:GNAT family N-acetyltransferase [Algoriphagus sp. CAU 1675]|uniref:GNAT family N-acetyltransferase n=1 Tax=Algoriphagus sp. CAU 1675 TaxID=3032597 RepID=UPI0023DA8250|nr:GNAT family N-acetyltransferase [Algoriphagus sp. CAU 1675]MDF2158498.1 GNAT family N-acetyltransferase [Algoriphagus sp. CAU 1675]
MEYTISVAEKSDLKELVEVARAAFVQAFTEGNKPENVRAYMEEAFTEEAFEKEMANPFSLFLILKIAGKIAGYCKVNFVPAQTDIHDPESLEIARLYILEDYLGTGVGKALMESALDVARQHHKKYVWLGVWEHNARAIRFYEKNGLRKFGEHPFPFGDEIQTDWLMRIDV